MTIQTVRALALAGSAVVGLAVVTASSVRAAAPTLRTVYFAAIDAAGQLVTDLTPAEVVVKENKQARDVVELVPATDRMHVAVLVDDGGAGGLANPVTTLVNVLMERAAFSISMMNPQPFRLNDYSVDTAVLRPAIGRLVQRGTIVADPLQMSEAVAWASRDLQKRELTRPVVVALVTRDAPGGGYIAEEIIDDLRMSGASLHVVYAGGIDMGRVLMEGPARSGGMHLVANSTDSFSQATIAIGRLLSRQYKLTYVLPDGVKPHMELAVTTTRPKVRLVAPTRVPNK